MDVSIIYVNYRTGQLIQNSIDSVYKHVNGIKYEIIVVDNSSNDGSVEEIKVAYPDVILIKAGGNLGFGRANNIGIKKARGEMVFFLNPDTLLVNNAVGILYDFLKKYEEVGACGGNLYSMDMRPVNSFGRVFPNLWQELASVVYLSPIFSSNPRSRNFNYTDSPMPVSMIIGADLMVKKNVLDRSGMFSPEFFMNFEETDLCYRIKKSGYKIYSVPNAHIIHLEGESESSNIKRLRFYLTGEYIYFKKHFGLIITYILFGIISLKCISRIVLFSLFFRKSKINYWVSKYKINLLSFKTFQ